MPKGAAPSKKSKKRAETEDEEDAVGDAPNADAEAEQRAAQRKEKKQKKKAATPEPEEEEEAPHEEEAVMSEAEDDGTAEERAKKKLRRQRAHKKVSGYRAKAIECGFKKGNGVIASSGIDMFASALTPADAKRLMRFVPEVLNKSSYDKNECAMRMQLSTEKVPPSAHARRRLVATVLRKFMNEAVLRSVEKGVMRVDAATMQSVLRPYQYNMTLSPSCRPRVSSDTHRARVSSRPTHRTRKAWSRRTRTTRSWLAPPRRLTRRSGPQRSLCQAQEGAGGGARQGGRMRLSPVLSCVSLSYRPCLK